MAVRPEQDKIEKLPKWAQEYIANIEREREISVRALNEYCDSQTPSAFSVPEYESTGEQQGPSYKVRYIQTRKMEVDYEGVLLRIYLRDDTIDLQWESRAGGMEDVAMIPQSFHRVTLKSASNMRRRS